jgi:hypothetical protein
MCIPVLGMALQVSAQHFGLAYVDIRLVPPDSVRVTVEADAEDLKNSAQVFPYYDAATGKGWESFRLYEQKIEAYFQQKLELLADGQRIQLRAVSWKPGGKSRKDGFDTVSIQAGNHAITLGGRIPAGSKTLIVSSQFWLERPELTPEFPPAIEYHFLEGVVHLRSVRSQTERRVWFPLQPDSLNAMRKHPLPPIPPRIPADHSTHGH